SKQYNKQEILEIMISKDAKLEETTNLHNMNTPESGHYMRLKNKEKNTQKNT
ncbi:3433_t:CDS:2, partial [Gigaspora margarita]